MQVPPTSKLREELDMIGLLVDALEAALTAAEGVLPDDELRQYSERLGALASPR